MAVIAYIGRLDYEDVEGGIHPNAAKYLVMTEGGMLLAFFIDQDGYLISEEYAGTSLRLDGASDVTGNNKASMVYDEESNFLFVAVYDGNGEIASVYAIDASDPSRVAVTGDFGPGVWPVVGLYEYEPATDLILKINPAALELFETQTAELNIKVKMGETNEYTVEVADPTVCSFEDGVVTALKEGETTITVTTVDVNDADQHLTKTINVLVHGLTALDVTIKGQVTDTNGARFANIMLDGPIAATSGAAAPGDVISGGRGGDLYLADMGGVPSVMDAETFEERAYYEVVRKKTASLFAACAQLGTQLAGGSEGDAERMRQFGQLVGTCFQLRDDIFDYGTPHDVGKPTGNDMREGKLTLPVIHVINKTKDKEMTDIARRVRRGEVSQEEIDALVAFTREKGGLDYAEWAMDEFRMMAAGLLDESAQPEIVEALHLYVDYVAQRNL